MATIEANVRHELLDASDADIDDAVAYADPMALRGLLFQLTGDAEVAAIETTTVMVGYIELPAPATEEGVNLLRRKAAEFLKAYRDSGAGPIGHGPDERISESLSLMFGWEIPDENLELYVQELALDPLARSLKWQAEPEPEKLDAFTVTVIGAGMGGLNAAVMLKQAGIPFVVLEKNAGVGGTWHENRYPGARVDTPSRSYSHIYGVDFGYPNPFCGGAENERYFNWVADRFELRDHIVHNIEVQDLRWDDEAGEWEITANGPDGEEVRRSRAVISAVGFLSRGAVPYINGAETFQGQSWHTSQWPEDMDLSDKRVAVIGTGSTGTQLIPELALLAEHVTVFQRTPQWLFGTAGYRSPFPPQVKWLDRNLPLHTNFMRARSCNNSWFIKMTTIDPDFDDPFACSATNKRARDTCLAFLEAKLDDPDLRQKLTPEFPVWSARAVVVDTEYSMLDAIQRDDVTLVSDGVVRITADGIEDGDGTRHELDVIVYATGFRAGQFFYPMTITGRGKQTAEDFWAGNGPRAYMGSMIPEIPNFWAIYGPNTNGGLPIAAFEEMTALYALQCIEKLILEDKKAIAVTEDAYWRYNALIEKTNQTKVWSDPRAHNYYWSEYGRSTSQNPFTPTQMWHYLRKPDSADLTVE